MSRTRQPWAEALADFLARTYPDASVKDLWAIIPDAESGGLELQDDAGWRWCIYRTYDASAPSRERLAADPLDIVPEHGPTMRAFERYLRRTRRKPFSARGEDNVLSDDRERCHAS